MTQKQGLCQENNQSSLLLLAALWYTFQGGFLNVLAYFCLFKPNFKFKHINNILSWRTNYYGMCRQDPIFLKSYILQTYQYVPGRYALSSRMKLWGCQEGLPSPICCCPYAAACCACMEAPPYVHFFFFHWKCARAWHALTFLCMMITYTTYMGKTLERALVVCIRETFRFYLRATILLALTVAFTFL